MVEGRPRRIGIWLLTGISIAASLAFLGWRLAGLSDGAVIPFYSNGWTADGVELQPIDQPPAGLQGGDLVTAIAGRSLNAWLGGSMDAGLDRSALEGNRPIAYTVRRDGATLEVAVTLRPRDVSGILLGNWSVVVFTVVLQAVALYVLWRRPEASAAAALAVAACGVSGSTLPWLIGLQASDIALGWPFLLYSLTAGGIYMLLWPAALHLALAFGAGPRGPGRRTLILVYAIPLTAYAAAQLAARLASPSASAWLGAWPTVQEIVIVPAIAVGIFLSVRVYRAARPATRRQLRWAAGGATAATATVLVFLFVPQLLTGKALIPWSAIGLIGLPFPIGLAVGILRHRLFDIEVVVNRALVYGGATVGILVVYAVSVSAIGTLVPLETGFPATLLATGLAAVAAIPLRDALQRGVNRLMYGDRDDPYRALTRLGRRLEGALDPVETPTVIVRTVAESLRVPWVALRFGAAGSARRTTEHGQRPPGDVVAVPLVSGAEVVGDLLVAPRSPSEPLSAADRMLLEALARQAGAAVGAVSLTLDLMASRKRLVAASEEERRRIRRDLHDGLGPSLAAIGMKAEVAADLVARDPTGAQAMLRGLQDEVKAALADVRRLVDALRPPALDELGLVGALEAQTSRLGPEPTFEVAADEMRTELPAGVEVAAYRIAVEAMTNAARHSGAHTCRVVLKTLDGESGTGLRIEVSDDGRGLPAQLRPGIGMASMRERAAEVGGWCRFDRLAGGGTRVVARLPLGGPAPSI